MNYCHYRWFIWLLIFNLSPTPIFSNPLLQRSRQLIVVFAALSSSQATLYEYERAKLTGSWRQRLGPIPVVLGKQGVAFPRSAPQGPYKKEGDKRTPLGIYSLGPMFGFAKKTLHTFPYVPLHSDTLCIDDPKSHYYNLFINAQKITHPDWHSFEAMRQIPEYQLGAVINYNTLMPVKDAGSCIFLHHWRNPTQGTAGCVALNAKVLKRLLTRLDPAKNLS